MKLFNWMRTHRGTINGVLITVFTSLILNAISNSHENIFKGFREAAAHILDLHSLGGVMILASLLLLLVFNAVYLLVLRRLKRDAATDGFRELMKRCTSPAIAASLGKGCLSWGESKTVEVCSDILFGWKPGNVMIDSYDDVMYRFCREEDRVRRFGSKSYYFCDEDWLSFRDTPAFREVIRRGNNLPRFMLRSCTKNYNRKERKLLVSLGRSEWSQTSYVWDRFGKKSGDEVDSAPLMREYAPGVSGGSESEPALPNSFCLHLLIETLDGMVILARISRAKANDNPGTWAATLGEQLEAEDFLTGSNFHDDFVARWTKRAFVEEFGFDENLYRNTVNEDSLRVLSVDFESDRYNFDLLCVVRLRCSFEAFNEKIAPTLALEEAVEIKGITLAEIPDILMTYRDETRRKDYHPSTYLRLLLYYLHRNGYSRTERVLREHARKKPVRQTAE